MEIVEYSKIKMCCLEFNTYLYCNWSILLLFLIFEFADLTSCRPETKVKTSCKKHNAGLIEPYIVSFGFLWVKILRNVSPRRIWR